MAASVFHVRKVSLGLRRKYRVSADVAGRPGELLAYAEKQLTVSDAIVLYRDETRAEQLATVRESSAGLRASLAGYEVFDAVGARLGTFGVQVMRSMTRTTWELRPEGRELIVGCERNRGTARVRRLVGLVGGSAGEVVNALTRYHFDFVQGDRPVLRIDKPKVFDDWYRVTVCDDDLDRTLLFAFAIMMEARQRG